MSDRESNKALTDMMVIVESIRKQQSRSSVALIQRCEIHKWDDERKQLVPWQPGDTCGNKGASSRRS